MADELDVTHILEGSVQRYENKMRIIVQLINAREDQHIWSQTYDRTVMLGLTSVFMIIEGNQVYWTQLLWIGFVIFGLREIRMENKGAKKVK